MNGFWILVLGAFAINSLEKAESVKLDEKPHKIIDEIFGEGWWDNDKDEEWNKLTLEHNFHYEIDRQNTQIEPNSTDQNPPLTESDHSGQIGPNSTDQNPPLTESYHSGQIEPNLTDQNPRLRESDHSGQIEPNLTDQLGQIEPISTDQNTPLTESDHSGQIETSTDQNPSLTESDHSDNAKNGVEQKKPINEMTSNENIVEDQKRKIIDKFHAMKDEFKQKGQYSTKEWNQIEDRIGKHFKVNCKKMFKWKKELDLSRRIPKNEREILVEKFDQMKAELKRTGFKNSYKHEIDKTVAKELGLSLATIYNWKWERGQTKPNHKHSDSEQKELMKIYYEIKDKNPKMHDKDIVKRLKIGINTLYRWKRQFKRLQFHLNSVDGHSVEENAGSTV